MRRTGRWLQPEKRRPGAQAPRFNPLEAEEVQWPDAWTCPPASYILPASVSPAVTLRRNGADSRRNPTHIHPQTQQDLFSKHHLGYFSRCHPRLVTAG